MPGLPMKTVWTDGTNDYGERTSALSVSRTNQLTLSYWGKRIADILGLQESVFRINNASNQDRLHLYYTSDRRIQIIARTSNNDVIRWLQSTNQFPATGSVLSDWHHIMLAFIGGPVGSPGIWTCLINGVDHPMGNFGANNSGDGEWDAQNSYLLASTGGATPREDESGDFWLDFAYMDPVANIGLFRDPANGCPVPLGDNGEIPTGTAPPVYNSVLQSGGPATYYTNYGTGGAYTQINDIIDGSSSPSDGCPVAAGAVAQAQIVTDRFRRTGCA